MTEKTPMTSRSDQVDSSSEKQSDQTKRASTTDQAIKSSAKKTSVEQPEPTISQGTSAAAKSSSSQKSSGTTGTGEAQNTSSKQAVRTDSTTVQKSTPKADAASTHASSSGSGRQADPVGAGSGGGSNGKTPPPSEPPYKKPSSTPLVVIAVVVLLLAGGIWYQHAVSKKQIERLESQVNASVEQARLATQEAQQALAVQGQQQELLATLQAGLNESRTEIDGLNSALQSITDRGSELVLLNDVDHLVTIAQQQLQLNGNVANAIISLETAQAQLARASRPALASLQQTINGDLDRLRATTTVDIALLSSRLDELAGLIGQAPLLVPDGVVSGRDDMALDERTSGITPSSRPAADVKDGEWWEKALAATQQWTSRTFASLRHDLGQFISVRRVDDAAALLISPDQATRFRDNLRQRIMTAQLALMMDQSLIWEAETDALLNAIESRFDPQSAVTRQAVRIARDIADTAIDVALPDVSNSIKALEVLNEQMGRGSMHDSSVTDPAGPSAESSGQTAGSTGPDPVSSVSDNENSDVTIEVPEQAESDQPDSASGVSHEATVPQTDNDVGDPQEIDQASDETQPDTVAEQDGSGSTSSDSEGNGTTPPESASDVTDMMNDDDAEAPTVDETIGNGVQSNDSDVPDSENDIHARLYRDTAVKDRTEHFDAGRYQVTGLVKQSGMQG